VVIFLYIFGHNYSVFLLFAVVLAYSFLNQFYVPAENASLPSLVSKEKLTKANSLFFLTQQLALVIGFGFAGIIEKLIGFEGSLILASSLLFIAFLAVYLLPKMQPKKELPQNWEDLIKIFFDHLIDGYKFIKNKKTILYPIVLLFSIQVGLAIITANLPSIASEILNVSTSYVGLLVVVPAGIGAVIGSLFLSKLLKIGWRKKKIIDLSLAILGLSVLGLVFGKLASTPILVVLVGIGFVGVNIPTLTFLQENTPEWLRGRVFGNLWFLITIATIFPVMFSGVISEFFGVKTLLTILSLGVILILMYSLKNGQKLIEENFN